MRKRILGRLAEQAAADEPRWLDLTQIASVEVTSEDESHPIEEALLGGTGSGWRASRPGEQVIRLVFDDPRPIRLIKLLFVESEKARTQQYVLKWASEGGLPDREILRQQYNFSPSGASRQAEVHTVNLNAVAALELRIIPDINGGESIASLASLQLA